MKMQANKNGFLRNFCVAALVSLLAQCVWAATPVAVWDGDFSNLTSNNYTITADTADGLTVAAGSITIGDSATKGIKITHSGTWAGATGITVALRYSNLVKGSDDKAIGVFKLSDKASCVGVRMNSEGKSAGIYSDAAWSNEGNGNTKGVAISSEGVMFLAFKTDYYTRLYKSDGTFYYNGIGLRESPKNVGDLITIGATASGKFVAKGMVITGIAIFDSGLSANDVAAYKFPSEIQHLTLTGNVTTADINAAIEGIANFDLTLDAGATVTITDELTAKVKLISAGNITFTADSKPTFEALAKFDVSGIAGSVTRSWTVDAFGFNFVSSYGAGTDAAMETTTWSSNAGDANGSASLADGLSIITWSSPNIYNDQASGSTLVRGYLDDSTGVDITVSNIPFSKYDVIIYASTDTSNATLTKKTVNGVDYTYDASNPVVAKAGTDDWGKSRSSANVAYGDNAIRIANQSAGTLVIRSEQASDTRRGCVSAIQIIPVGDPICTIGTASYDTLKKAMLAATGTATAETPVTVTLTAATAESVKIPENVILNTNSKNYTGAVSGSGVISYVGFGTVPNEVKTSLRATDWTGTLSVSPTSTQLGQNDNTVGSQPQYKTLLNDFGNEGSKIEFNNFIVTNNDNNNYFGLTVGADSVVQPEVVVVGELTLKNGYSHRAGSTYYTSFRKISGKGKINCPRDYNFGPLYYIGDLSAFFGEIYTKGNKFVVGDRDATNDTADKIPYGTFFVKDGYSVTVPVNKNWTATKLIVEGTLKLADGATFTVPELTAGSVTTDVEGKMVVYSSDKYSLANIVAKIGDTPYASVEDAIAHLGEGQTITLVDTTAQLPEGWTTVTTGDVVTLRQAGDIYWTANSTDWNANTTFATSEGGTDSTKMIEGDVVHFTVDQTIYTAAAVSAVKIAVKGGVTLTVGHANNGNHHNLPTGSTIDLGDGAKVSIQYWGNDSIQGTATFGDITINGANGTFSYNSARTNPPTFGAVSGTAKLVLGEGQSVTATSFATTPISGVVTKRVVATEVAGGIKYSLETIQPEPPTPTEGGITPSIPGADKIEIVDAEGTTVTGGTIPLETGVYTVTGKVGETVVATETLAVVKSKDAETGTKPDPVTVAVAVPFKGATVANLLNTALLKEGDELKAFVGGSYSAWTLAADKKTWTPVQKARDGADPEAGAPATTPLARGTAVWVTTAGKVVAFGAYDSTAEVSEVTKGYNLIGNPTMESLTLEAETVGDILIPVGGSARYTTIKKTDGSIVWQCSESVQDGVIPGTNIPAFREDVTEEDPTIQVGGGAWFIVK